MSFEKPNVAVCDACDQNGYRCHCEEPFCHPSPTQCLSREQQLDPFADQNALRNSEINQRTVDALRLDMRKAATEEIVIPAISDDGLPSSLPSRYTLSAKSSRLLDRYRPPPLPLTPRRMANDHTLSRRSSQASIHHNREDLVTPRDSPKRQAVFTRAPVCTRSETASIHGVGEPVRVIRGSQQTAGVPKRLSASLPHGYTARARPSVQGQKEPFPLLSPVLAKEEENPLTQGQHITRHENTGVKTKARDTPTRLWRGRTKPLVMLAVVLQLSLIMSTAAVVMGVKDSKADVLQASTVIAGVLGFAGYIACVLCGWALWLNWRRRKDTIDQEVEAEKVANMESQEWSEKACRQSQQAHPLQPEPQCLNVASNSRMKSPEDGENQHTGGDSLIGNPSLSRSNEAEEGSGWKEKLEGHELEVNLTTARRTRPPPSELPLPSSGVFPPSLGIYELEAIPQSDNGGMYREILESRLLAREYLESYYGKEELKERVARDEDRTNDRSIHDRQTTQKHPEKEEGQKQEAGQENTLLNQHDHNELEIQTSSMDAASKPVQQPHLLAPSSTRPQYLSLGPLDFAPASAYDGPSQPSFSSYPALSSFLFSPKASQASINQSPAVPSSSIFHHSITCPSPTHQPPSTIATVPHYEEAHARSATSFESVACSDTSSMREARTMKSVQKVRVWQKFMLDSPDIEAVNNNNRLSGNREEGWAVRKVRTWTAKGKERADDEEEWIRRSRTN